VVNKDYYDIASQTANGRLLITKNWMRLRTHLRGKVRRSAKRLEKVGDRESSEKEDARQQKDVWNGVGDGVSLTGFADGCPAVLSTVTRRRAVISD